jgi:hypothetical protein
MKTTIDLPDDLLHGAKVFAAQQKSTLKELVIRGLNIVMESGNHGESSQATLSRMRKGLRLGGKPLTRAQAHEG